MTDVFFPKAWPWTRCLGWLDVHGLKRNWFLHLLWSVRFERWHWRPTPEYFYEQTPK